MMTEGFIRTNHPYGFRSGEWAQIMGVDEGQYSSPCWAIRVDEREAA